MEDLIGMVFKRLTVIGLSNERYRRHKMWVCKCECGEEKVIAGFRLKQRSAISCGKCTWSSTSFEVKEDHVIGTGANGEQFTLDIEDFEKVKHLSWNVNKSYVISKINRNHVSLHRLILGFPKSNIDHIDGNPRNNRKSNLRIVSQQQNCFNSQKNKRDGSFSSSYKGVSRPKGNKKFQAQIRKGNNRYHLGWYETEVEAAEVYNKKALELHGEFAKLNDLKGGNL